jgi:glycosyltransferase involved in cell wall biosynthesis
MSSTIPIAWGVSIFLAGVWLSRVLVVGLNIDKIPEISGPEYDLPPLDSSGRVPRVSIVVPARNEAEHIDAALRSLLELDYPDYEVIAIDDRSDDETGAVMDLLSESRPSQGSSGSRLQVLHIEDLPGGWLGKTHAMWRGAQLATGEWILFTDADVVFRADALRRAIVYAERETADHAVLFPTMVMKSVGERMMIALFQSQFVFARLPWKASDPKSRDAIGVGAFNLIRREVYERIGTYERMRLEILDDMRLGEIVKHEGFRQQVAFGRELLRLRWVSGTYGMVRNLTKNGFAILRFNVWFALLAVCGILLVNVGPYVGVMFAPGWSRLGFGAALAVLLTVYIGMSWYSDVPPYYVLLHPIAALVFCYALVRSAVLTLVNDGVDWRDTHYSLTELRAFMRERPRWNWL